LRPNGIISQKNELLLEVSDYNDALTFAESDLKANWGVYKERFFEGVNLWKGK